MNRPLVFLLIVGALIAGGIILSFYSAQLTTKNIIVKEESILPDSPVEVSIELDPSVGETGVFAVVVIENFEEDSISVSVIDPIGSQIISKIAEKESIFDITSVGTYKLEIKNSGIKESKVVVGLGYMPNTGTQLIGIIGTSLLIAGLIGIVGIGVYSIRHRQK